MCGQSWSKSKWSFFITDYVTIPTIYINISCFASITNALLAWSNPTYGEMDFSLFVFHFRRMQFFTLHSLLPPMLLPCFSYWYIHVEEFHLRAY